MPPALLFGTAITLQATGFSPLHAALTFIPLSLASVPAAAGSVALAPRLGRRLTIGGALIVAVGIDGLLLAVHLAGPALPTWTLLPGMATTGTGLGLVAPTLIDIALAAVDAGDAGAASRIRATAPQLGGAIGVALIGVVFYGALSGGPLAPARATATPPLSRAACGMPWRLRSSALWPCGCSPINRAAWAFWTRREPPGQHP